MRRFPALLLASATLVLGACSLAGDVTPPPGLDTLPLAPTPAPSLTAPRQAPDVAAGEALFGERCAPCHGPTGRGDGEQAQNLPVPPAALADPSIARAAIPDEWYTLVTVGRLDRFMPGFTSLNDADRWSVVGYALSLGLEPASVAQGEQIFAVACSDCHGDDGRGSEAGSDLTEPALQAERSLQMFFEAVSVGVADEMPGFEASLSDEERWAVASYVRWLGLQAEILAPDATATASPTPSLATEAATTPQSGVPSPTMEAGETQPSVTAAAGTPTPAAIGVIEGTITNGSAGGRVPPGLEVTLHGLDGETEVLTQTRTADSAGRFTFEVPDLVSGRLYVATVDYGGELYASEVAHLTSDAPAVSLPVTVYETTTDTSSVRVDRLHILATLPGEGIVQIVELWIFSNTGDRSVVPPEEGGGLRGTLPEGAAQLSFDEATPGERYEVTGAEFVDRRGLTPGVGTGEWVFSYVLPYDRRVDLRRSTDYPIGSIVLLVPEGVSVSADGLVDTGSREVGGDSLHTYSMGPIGAQSDFSVRFSGGGGTRALSAPAAEWILGIGVLGIALIVAGLLWRRPRQAVRADVVSDADDLLLSIAALDRDFEAGRIEEADYRRRRDALKRRAMAAMQSGDD